MVALLTAMLILSLLIVFCMQHFFIQLIALKLFIDTLVFILISLRKSEQFNFSSQAAAWFVAGFSCMAFFILMAAGTQRFSRSATLDVETDNE